ncbi:MAG: polyphosphate polymerase domain-containing protein [Bacteroidota bacterium]|nr:polyphosphate polymerase domain-containing protein [Bacteroidota bacterium]
MKAAVQAVLDTFETITLEEMDRVKLMDRTDQKFNFNIAQLPELLAAVRDEYRVLEVSGTKMSRYETLYYDTPSFDLFRQHHNGQTNRYKIRMRRYVESDLNFFEVKFKNNKGRTIKKRVKKTDLDKNISGKSLELLENTSGMGPDTIEPKLWVNYNRITLVNKTDEERITIDLDLEVKNADGTADFSGLVIVEAKQAKAHDTPFVRCLKNLHIREGGTSKYCLAVSKLIPDIKKNNFKPDLIHIQKIIDDTNAA